MFYIYFGFACMATINIVLAIAVLHQRSIISRLEHQNIRSFIMIKQIKQVLDGKPLKSGQVVKIPSSA